MDEYSTNLANFIIKIKLNKEWLASRTKMLEGLLKREETPGIIFGQSKKIDSKLTKRLSEKFWDVEIEKADCYKEPIIELDDFYDNCYHLPAAWEESLLDDIKSESNNKEIDYDTNEVY